MGGTQRITVGTGRKTSRGGSGRSSDRLRRFRRHHSRRPIWWWHRMVWDRGTYELTPPGDPLEAVRKGKLHVILHGEKARGEWALIRIRAEGGKNQWLLMKTAGGVKPISKKRDDQSVKTGRTMKQIASARDAEWQSHRVDKKDSFKARIAKAARNVSLKKKDQNKIVGQA